MGAEGPAAACGLLGAATRKDWEAEQWHSDDQGAGVRLRTISRREAVPE